MIRRSWRIAALAVGLAFAAPTIAQSSSDPSVPPPQAAAAAASWRALFGQDLTYLTKLIPSHYIYAVYPGGPTWDTQFRRNVAQAEREAALVHDFGSYRAVLQHFVVAFEDAHFSAYFNVLSHHARWPGFAVKYQGGQYIVARSTIPGVGVGEAVAACDGRPLDGWMDSLAAFYGGPVGRETTRASIARQFLVDSGNPLYKLPRICHVGTRDVTLNWAEMPAGGPNAMSVEQERTAVSAPTLTDSSATLEPFGPTAGWVRIGTMMPSTAGQARQFNDIIARAPSLRDKDFVVIDVRGNPGGTYNWFMAFLRSFYGQPYADYYARARLEIVNVTLNVSPTGRDNPGFSPEVNQIQMPPDPPMTTDTGAPDERVLPGGSKLIIPKAPVGFIHYPAIPPANPVRAKVYLLTDYACASACLSFTDEMMRFPGVTQIGAETHIDRRSGGWPEGYQLPSGLAVMRMGRMVREDRKRGDNEAWIPQYHFDGDITDTPAVKNWIANVIVPHDLANGSAK